jgi:60 kDa SS-A/Ro ribonucleoprotein
MSRFNTKATGTKTINQAGGQAYSQSPELELVSTLLTSFANDQFYRKANDQFANLKALIGRVDKKFVAQAAIYARTKFGMRSISHVAASELAKHIGGQKWAKDFYNAIVYRPDDMMEILSYHLANNGKETNAMRKGIGQAFAKFTKYELAKYRGENKSMKLVDVANLVHPKPTEANKEAIEALIKGNLKSFDTWETELTQAGQTAENDEQKEELKKEAWIKLVREKKIGYFALLRNLRNIIEQAPEVLTEALAILVEPDRIKKSLVLPFRFTTAYEEIEKLSDGKKVREVLIALNKAVDISISNVPKFDGDTLVVLDVSGSMQGRPSQIGSLFAAVLVKSNNADFLTFDNDARYQNLNPNDSTISLSKAIRFTGGGTNFHSIFQTANQPYHRIIILSDMQGWIGHDCPAAAFNKYKETTKADPFIYSFDLNSYGNMQFPEKNVFCLAGFSEKIFDVMKLMEQDKQALINEIRKVEF